MRHVSLQQTKVFAIFGQCVADALAEPAVATGHQCDRALEVHDFTPVRGRADLAPSSRAEGQFDT